MSDKTLQSARKEYAIIEEKLRVLRNQNTDVANRMQTFELIFDDDDDPEADFDPGRLTARLPVRAGSSGDKKLDSVSFTQLIQLEKIASSGTDIRDEIKEARQQVESGSGTAGWHKLLASLHSFNARWPDVREATHKSIPEDHARLYDSFSIPVPELNKIAADTHDSSSKTASYAKSQGFSRGSQPDDGNQGHPGSRLHDK